MAITLFGVASTPTDNGTNVTDPTVITVPSSMQVGDLCILYAIKRVASGSISFSNAGGQSWTQINSTVNSSGGVLTGAAFWCRFNGTWSANPSISFSSTNSNIVVMLVYRPNSSSSNWGFQPFTAFQNYPAQTTLNSGSVTPNNHNSVTVQMVGTDDDNTWTFTGTNWTQSGLSAQYRNTSGSDTCIGIIYQIQNGAAAPLNTYSMTQGLGPDGGVFTASNWYEIATDIPNKSFIKNQSVNRSYYY